MDENEPWVSVEQENIIQEIEVARARVPLVIELADLAIEHSDEVTGRIQREIEELEPETDEAIATLRRAGLLRD